MERAVALDPNDGASRFNLALALMATGDVPAALRERDALRGIDPGRAAELHALMARAGERPAIRKNVAIPR